MKRKYLFIPVLFIILIPLIIRNYSEDYLGINKPTLLAGSIDLENSIIIKELTMETESPPEDPEEKESSGHIIYDESFDDTIADDGIPEKGRGEKNSAYGQRITVEKLRKKDVRWHLVRYRIRKNDNLWKVAERFGISHTLIISINGINNPDMLLPGKSIDIPSRDGIYYRVKRGDTLSEIAKRYGIKSKKIRNQNSLKGKYLLAGKKIFLPGAVTRSKSKGLTKRRRRKTSFVAKRGGIRFTWPLRGRLTSGFGRRKDPFSNRRQFHCGIDISANIGTRIKASAKGKVIFSGWKQGYGKVVILRHKQGYITVYAHNSRNLVKQGKAVRKGDLIAFSGNTGAVTGAHLHFEIRKYVTPLNPIRLLRQ